MKTIIKGIKTKVTPEIESYIEKKITELEKFVSRFGDITVFIEIGQSTFHHKHGDIFFAKADVKLPKKTIHAEAEMNDLFSAIDKIKDELKIELRKYKDKAVSEIYRQTKG
ncbi:MAG: ribosome-associated translation inhibitor RaiA [Patescibacteria group bacterium]|nr:ribosome-associated translation inhibitor RaiA [Patescibacteria group bacterium]